MEEHKHDESCLEVFALLSQYLDAELAPASCAEIEKHLAGCQPCIEFLESLKRSVKVCHDCDPAAESPAPLDPKVRERLLAAYKGAVGHH